MTWQEWIVGIIVFLCAVEVIRRIILFFRTAKNNENPCASCATGCELKQLFEDKQQKCKGEQKKPSKKCCG